MVLECATCNKTFTKKSSFKQHMLTHSEQRIKLFCPVCSKDGVIKTFSKNSNLVQHCRNVHQGTNVEEVLGSCERKPVKITENPHQCHICGKKYKVKASLKIHVSEVHEIRIKPLCQLCGKQFQNDAALKKHLKKTCQNKIMERNLNKKLNGQKSADDSTSTPRGTRDCIASTGPSQMNDTRVPSAETSIDKARLDQNYEFHDEAPIPHVDPSPFRGVKRKRMLERKLIDEVKIISKEVMRSQFINTADIINTWNLAPTKKIFMYCKETGSAEKLFALPSMLPSINVRSEALLKDYQ